MAELFLVRHGQASFGADDYDQLSGLGEQQSFWLGQYFAERHIEFDKIIIGASIRYGKHKPELYEFIQKNVACLEAKENAFFSVNVVARKPEKNTPETNPYMQKFLELSPWSPKKLAVFAGKIDYPKYKFIDKHMIRLIMWITKGPTDVKNTYEFTDWNQVDEFSKQLNT